MTNMRVTIDPKCVVYRPGSICIEVPAEIGRALCAASLAVDGGPVPGQVVEEAESRAPARAQRAVTRKSRRRRR